MTLEVSFTFAIFFIKLATGACDAQSDSSVRDSGLLTDLNLSNETAIVSNKEILQENAFIGTDTLKCTCHYCKTFPLCQ